MYLLFDIGGTKMRLAVSKDGSAFEEARVLATPKVFEEGVAAFKAAADELLAGEKAQALCGGIAGPLDPQRTFLINSPNLPQWVGKPLAEEFEKMFEAPVFIENDSAIVGLGEAVAGAGRDKSIVAYVTVSTGVGGVRIVDGSIDRSARGFEIGHQIIDASGGLCPDCPGGELENLVSGTAVEAHYKTHPSKIHDSLIWDTLAKWLAIGLNNITVHWSPDIIVLGGSMMKEVGIPVERVRAHLKNIMRIFPDPPPVEKAILGDIGGLHGALAFLGQKMRK